MFMGRNTDSRGTLSTKRFKCIEYLVSMYKKLMKWFMVNCSLFPFIFRLMYLIKLAYMFLECEYCVD